MEFTILKCKTPQAWLEKAVTELPTLLIDHAKCEKKAASTALALIYRYPYHWDLVERMSRLAREELRHFEQVLKIMRKREIAFTHMTPGRYAKGLLKYARTHEPARLIDNLIIGAFVEARSCERFSALVPLLDAELSKFYTGLLASEARHYEHYINFAREFSKEPIDERIAFYSEVEETLIVAPDEQFRFHSGIPISGKPIN
jgi:tRNA-(ms[2]io[6]A)-hydroxylase